MYDANIILCIVTADPHSREQYVLSTRDDSIVFPTFKPNDCNTIVDGIHNVLNSYFIDYIKTLNAFLIDINSNNINALFDSNNTLNILYGVIVPKHTCSEQYFWKNFTFNDLSIPNELVIIGETIRRAF